MRRLDHFDRFLIVFVIFILGLIVLNLLPPSVPYPKDGRYPQSLESDPNGLRMIDTLPCHKVVDGMTVTLEEIHTYQYPWGNYDTCFNYSVDKPGWLLKKVKGWGYRAKQVEYSCFSYNFPDPRLSIGQPVSGLIDLELRFQEYNSNDFYIELPQGAVDVPSPGKSKAIPYDFTAFGATLHIIGAFGTGAEIPGTGERARVPCIAFSIQGAPSVTFTVFTCTARMQPILAKNQSDFQSPQACVQFPLPEASDVAIYAIGPKVRVFHYFVKVPSKIEPYHFYGIN